MSYKIKVKVWGKTALFTRPETKVERYSYDVITPSAARGLLESIYWSKGLKWVIDKIYVQNPIKFSDQEIRNEVKKKINREQVLAAMNGSHERLYINVAEERTQRASVYLKDVSYVIEAHFELEKGTTEAYRKHQGIMKKRLKRGACFCEPYLGCRQCTAYFRPYTDEKEPETIKETRDLGIMLYDKDYSDPSNIKPIFFRAIMKDGVIDVKNSEILK